MSSEKSSSMTYTRALGQTLWSLAVLFLTLSTTSSAQRACFFPDGTRASGDIACNPDASSESACCGVGYACLANGICQQTSAAPDNGGVRFIRGSCTDISWQSSSCPQFCIDRDNSMYTSFCIWTRSAVIGNEANGLLFSADRQFWRRKCHEPVSGGKYLVL